MLFFCRAQYLQYGIKKRGGFFFKKNLDFLTQSCYISGEMAIRTHFLKFFSLLMLKASVRIVDIIIDTPFTERSKRGTIFEINGKILI